MVNGVIRWCVGKHLDKLPLDSIAVPLFTNPNYSETSKLVYCTFYPLSLSLSLVTRWCVGDEEVSG